MTTAELWRGIGAWWGVAYCLTCGLSTSALAWTLFHDQRPARWVLLGIASVGTGWAYGRYRGRLRLKDEGSAQ